MARDIFKDSFLEGRQVTRGFSATRAFLNSGIDVESTETTSLEGGLRISGLICVGLDKIVDLASKVILEGSNHAGEGLPLSEPTVIANVFQHSAPSNVAASGAASSRFH